MSRRAKYTIEQKIRAAERYIKGEASAASIAAELGMTKSGKKQIVEWATIYREKGIEGFHIGDGNGRHTSEKKKQAVEEYLQGRGSLREICRRYHIMSHRTLRQWI